MSASECKNIFKSIKKLLEKKPWFKKEAWIVKDHGFPFESPEFQTLHVFKEHWFNEDRLGIHIESFLAHDPTKRKKSNVTVHLLHYPKIPNTSISRKVFAKEVVDSILPMIKKRAGYSIRAGKYGTQPFSFNLDGTSDDFVHDLEREISWLCQNVGKHIDVALSKLIDSQA